MAWHSPFGTGMDFKGNLMQLKQRKCGALSKHIKHLSEHTTRMARPWAVCLPLKYKRPHALTWGIQENKILFPTTLATMVVGVCGVYGNLNTPSTIRVPLDTMWMNKWYLVFGQLNNPRKPAPLLIFIPWICNLGIRSYQEKFVSVVIILVGPGWLGKRE